MSHGERIIEGPACLQEGCAWLTRAEPRFAPVLEAHGLPPLRRHPEGYGQLLSAITGQQVSIASAAAVWARLEAAGLTTPAPVLAASEEDLRACGLSRQKARYAKALAEARIDYGALARMPSHEVIATLTAVPGIGPWTAEIYAMFSLGRADVIAAGDMAMQEAARSLFDLPARPSERDLRALAAPWSPWRAVAARLLWSYYLARKGREGIR